MKKTLFSLLIISLVFTACPPLLEDDDVFVEATISYEGALDHLRWLNILQEVETQRKYIKLDLKNCTYIDDNKEGGLIKVTLTEHDANTGEAVSGSGDPTYIAFDPMPAIAWGKDKIVSIVLPDKAQMINQATPKRVDSEKDADKKNSAFANFTNLRSVSAENVKIIGNYAFVDNKNLRELDFPSVGHTVTDTELGDTTNSLEKGFRVDIGHYAFKGCTGLVSVTFNLAAVIGRHAFEGCTNLASVSFPAVWMIGQNAFEGCENLTSVRFEAATKIGDESFMDCKRLKTVFFQADPTGGTSPIDGGGPSYDSVIFYPKAFFGCKALKTINIRNAWNVYFSESALANIGTSIELYLFDDSGTKSSGHPQLEPFLGEPGSTVSVLNVSVFIPADAKNVNASATGNIAGYIKENYSTISVSVTQ